MTTWRGCRARVFGVSGARKQTGSSPAIAPTSEGWARFVRTINVSGGQKPERPLRGARLECVCVRRTGGKRFPGHISYRDAGVSRREMLI